MTRVCVPLLLLLMCTIVVAPGAPSSHPSVIDDDIVALRQSLTGNTMRLLDRDGGDGEGW